jgi:hypothetical protein
MEFELKLREPIWTKIWLEFEFHGFGRFTIWWNLDRKLPIASSIQQTLHKEIWDLEKKFLLIDLKIEFEAV